MESNENIEVIREEVKEIPKDSIVIIATGPLTSDKMASDLISRTKTKIIPVILIIRR